jgi:uncharacterized membrane protein
MRSLPGPLDRFDKSALAAAEKASRFYSRPTSAYLLSFWAYLVTVVIAMVWSRYFPQGRMREVVFLMPLLTLLLIVGVNYWIYRASDEYLRLRILKCAALTGVLLAFATLGYAYLEQLGYPHLSMIVVNVGGLSLFIVQMVWVRYRAR